ncbi:MAG: 1-(5-phosphoribosyl)-5-[(5-phosphoribosylamino)methylideneamino]imidazole-4-carboxamide isomerase, partial [Pedobacter sp.]
MIVIPAIDIIDGKCVRLLRGDYDQQTNYSDDPSAMAVSFETMGVERLHLVDLDGAKKGSIVNAAVLKRIASLTKLSIDFGGGVSSEEDIKGILNAGADMVTIGSLAVKQPGLLEQWIREYGADKFFIGADVLNEQIKIRGWLEDGGVGIIEFIGK